MKCNVINVLINNLQQTRHLNFDCLLGPPRALINGTVLFCSLAFLDPRVGQTELCKLLQGNVSTSYVHKSLKGLT